MTLTTSGSRPTAADRVIDGIINSLVTGELKPGGQIPTEPELCERFKVGRNSVREAIKQLQALGMLHIRRPEGTFVAESYNDKMLNPLLFSLILEKKDWDDFVQLRAVIDIGTMHVALEDPRITGIVPELDSYIRGFAREFKADEPSIDRLLELDMAFHKAISAAVGNAQVQTVNDFIEQLTIPTRRVAVRRWIDEHQGEAFVKLHQQIVDMIANRDIKSIERVIYEHYVYWRIIQRSS